MGTSAMRKTETGFLTVQNTSLTRAMRLAAIALGVGLVMAAGPVRAGDDDEDDDRTFEEKIIHNLMTGIGGKNMESKGIEYRERSPLVVPPRLDLPPPAGAEAEVKASNWPKDPDAARRKAAIAARKKENKDPRAAARPLTPQELSVGKLPPTAPTSGMDSDKPGNNVNYPIMSPSQLGWTGSIGNLFGGGNKSEVSEFKGEPPRSSLVEPPVGYQTPSPNFAYGTGPRESLNKGYYDVVGDKQR
jgi:hypothetical protein